MLKGKYLSIQDDLSEVYRVRQEVFEVEQKMPQERDDLDAISMHVILYDDDVTVGTGRIAFDGETFEISKVAVLADRRRQGYGDFIVRMLLDRAFQAGGTEIFLDAVAEAVPFFQSIGFKANGEEYEKDGARYVPMKVIKGKVITQCGHQH